MARVTKVSSTAPEKSFAAAAVTLPGDVLVAMFWTVVLAHTDACKVTLGAFQVFFSCCGFEVELSLTVNQASEERLLASSTLVECCLSGQVLLLFVVPLTVDIPGRL